MFSFITMKTKKESIQKLKENHETSKSNVKSMTNKQSDKTMYRLDAHKSWEYSLKFILGLS